MAEERKIVILANEHFKSKVCEWLAGVPDIEVMSPQDVTDFADSREMHTKTEGFKGLLILPFAPNKIDRLQSETEIGHRLYFFIRGIAQRHLNASIVLIPVLGEEDNPEKISEVKDILWSMSGFLKSIYIPLPEQHHCQNLEGVDNTRVKEGLKFTPDSVSSFVKKHIPHMELKYCLVNVYSAASADQFNSEDVGIWEINRHRKKPIRKGAFAGRYEVTLGGETWVYYILPVRVPVENTITKEDIESLCETIRQEIKRLVELSQHQPVSPQDEGNDKGLSQGTKIRLGRLRKLYINKEGNLIAEADDEEKRVLFFYKEKTLPAKLARCFCHFRKKEFNDEELRVHLDMKQPPKENTIKQWTYRLRERGRKVFKEKELDWRQIIRSKRDTVRIEVFFSPYSELSDICRKCKTPILPDYELPYCPNCGTPLTHNRSSKKRIPLSAVENEIGKRWKK